MDTSNIDLKLVQPTSATTTRTNMPIGVPIKPKRKPTRYEIHRRIEGAYPAWEQLEVVHAPSARAALRLYAADHSLEASDELNVTLRAIPVSRITQVRVAVEQRSTLTFS